MRKSAGGRRPAPRGAAARRNGYVLLVVMAMATMLLVALTVVIPSVYQEAQREREAELIFRGMQYARAIALFRRQFQRFPMSTKELLQTNGMRFLRQEFPDPMDPKGKWRFIHANAAGVVLDSKIQGGPNNPNQPGGSFGGSQGSQTPFGGSGGQSGSSSGFGFSSSGTMSQSGSQWTLGSSGSGSQSGSQSTSAFSGPASGSGVMGAFIVGVAATSHRKSIRVYNDRTHYDEWEFLGLDLSVLGVPGGVGLPGGQQTTGTGGFRGTGSGSGGLNFSPPPGPRMPPS